MGGMELQHDPASAGVVRRAIAADLREASITGETAQDVILVASELVGNAVVHTTVEEDGLAVTWDVGPDTVFLEVHDGSTTMPRRRSADGRDPSGRGLAIVDSLSADWGVRRTALGKQVWARVPVSRSA